MRGDASPPRLFSVSPTAIFRVTLDALTRAFKWFVWKHCDLMQGWKNGSVEFVLANPPPPINLPGACN